MQTSAGLILTDGEKLLICHPSRSPYWDLPKGGIKEYETPLQACIRETWEETDFDISNKTPIDLGTFKYTKRKRLHLFMIKTDKLPSISFYKCNSFVELNDNKLPEMDKYMYITFAELENFLTPAMQEVLKSIFKNSINVINKGDSK